jgi:hypothetical protein
VTRFYDEGRTRIYFVPTVYDRWRYVDNWTWQVDWDKLVAPGITEYERRSQLVYQHLRQSVRTLWRLIRTGSEPEDW